MDISIPTLDCVTVELSTHSSFFFILPVTGLLPFPYFCASFRITFLLSFSILHLYLRRNTYDEITRGTYLCNIFQTLTLAYLNKFSSHGTILKKNLQFFMCAISLLFPSGNFISCTMLYRTNLRLYHVSLSARIFPPILIGLHSSCSSNITLKFMRPP